MLTQSNMRGDQMSTRFQDSSRTRRPTHQYNQSLFTTPPIKSSPECVFEQTSPGESESPSRAIHRPTRSAPKAIYYRTHCEKPLPPLKDMDTLRGKKDAHIGANERDDVSHGSWLDEESYMSGQESSVEDGNHFDLEQYLVSSSNPISSSVNSATTIPHATRQSRVAMFSRSPLDASQPQEVLEDKHDFAGSLSTTPSLSNLSSIRSAFLQADASALAKTIIEHSTSDVAYETSSPTFTRPSKSTVLPDPANFPDPYPHGLSYHHPPPVMPALSSAGSSSASTRSSAYTNPGSTISSFGISGDYSHVRVASADGMEGGDGLVTGISPETIAELLSRASNGSSLSSSSRKSHTSPIERVRRTNHARNLPPQPQSEDHSPTTSFEAPERVLRSQPSYDTSWQRDNDEREEFVTSEEEFDYGEQPDADEDEKEEELPAAIVVAEEGRGLIVHGEGSPIASLKIQPGITHLLVGGSSTPNSVPSFLNTTLPQISVTLLALDISANFLPFLSPALAACVALEELNISSNPLRVLPEFLAGMTSLRLLIADSTGISTIPPALSALQKLHTLSIRRNKMYTLPSWLCTLPSLESLLVDGNPFQGPWKALVEPLLAKVPMTPMYPPSTPMLPQLSATTTNTETSDVSDTDLTDHEEPSPTGSRSLTVPVSAPLDSRFIANIDEDHTITPANAKLLERSATSPTLPSTLPSTSPPRAPQLTRTRTTPNRSFYERERKKSIPSNQVPTGDPSEQKAMNSYSPFTNQNPKERSELRRMHSADELRRVMQLGSTSTSPESPPRSVFPHATNTIATAVTENVDALSQQRRFASLGAHSRTPSRTATRPPLSSAMWNEQSIDEDADGDEDVESPPRPSPRSRPVTPAAGRRDRGSRVGDVDPLARQSAAFAKQKPVEREKSSSGRRWGFLKKMSMGKLRTMDGAAQGLSSRPSTSQGLAGHIPGGPNFPTSSMNTMRLSPPQLEVDIVSSTDSGNTIPPSGPLASSSLKPAPIRALPTDKLQVPVIHPVSPSSSLLTPSSPSPRSAKRRSFLPIDGPPALNIPIPSTAPFLSGITATNGGEDQDDVMRRASPIVASPIVESPQDMQKREEEKIREANARALRSVMAYLRDMNDLTTISQGSVLSVYGPSSIERMRRPTVVEDTRLRSETSIDSVDSSTSTANVSLSMRSFESGTGVRSTSSNTTMSVVTTDSSGSGGDERRSKDDRGKRKMVIREIVETERTYVRGMQELMDIYVRPAEAPANLIGGVGTSSKETIVPAAERKIVFGGVGALFSFHRESFLPALEAAAAPLLKSSSANADADSDGKLSTDIAMAVGRTFVSHAAFMKMYSSYINNFENSVHRIRQWVTERPGTSTASSSAAMTPSSSTAQLVNFGLSMSAVSTPTAVNDNVIHGRVVSLSSGQRKRIKTYMKRCRINPRHSQLNLEGYLLLPVQRIPRYRLLLEELIRSTLPPSDSFDDPLERALNEISSLATNMNEGKREAESRRKLVQWQSRIRGKFPSPLVQPHRRLIMDGRLKLTRIVRKQTVSFEIVDSNGNTPKVDVECLAPEQTPRPLYGILCNDLFVLCRDPSNGQDPNSPVDLWAVLRMQTMPQPTSIVHTNELRIVDTKAVLYLEAPSPSEALTWFRAINLHVPASKRD